MRPDFAQGMICAVAGFSGRYGILRRYINPFLPVVKTYVADVANSSKKIPKVDETAKIPSAWLVFDKSNPRLTTGDDVSARDDVTLISTYREISALDELVTSICANGYIDLEPLIVMSNDDEMFVVLEGNRRLAAMKVIRDPELARKCKVPVPREIPQWIIDSFENVTVHRVKDAASAHAFIGFKHINGPQRWDAYAKARFVADWYREGRRNGMDIETIARQTGDTNDTIRSYIGSVFVLDQAERTQLFEIKNRSNKGRFAFSHLYTALDRPEYRRFLGLELGWNKEPTDNPIPEEHLDELEEVLGYLYGSKRDSKASYIESQNPDLAVLGRCLVNDRALQRLRNGDPLNSAFAEIAGSNLFGEALSLVSVRLDKAIDLAPKFDGGISLFDVVEEIILKAETLRDMMEKVVEKSKAKTKPKAK